MADTVIQIAYRPRWYQGEFELAMTAEGKRRAFLLYHRRAGKDIACWNFLINAALLTRPGVYFYVLPTYRQGKRVIWDGIDEGGSKLLDAIPAAAIQGKPNATEMKISLVNGAVIQIVGSEQYDSLRGTNPKGVVFSEYAMQDPRCYTEVISPILRKNGGWAVFNTTPLGKNHAYDLWQMAESNQEWYTQKLTIEDTGLITRDQIEAEMREGKTEEIIEQEYYCSFARGIDGTYYGRLMSSLHDKGQITSVPYDPVLPVHTAWDLGIGDSTAIWFWQQTRGGEVHFIDYYENCGESITHYVSVLRDRDYGYDRHFLPHDANAQELGTGATIIELLRAQNVRPTLLPRSRVDDGIQATRAVLPRCWFDAVKCAQGIRHLENYRKHYSDKLKTYLDRPLHDEHSHCADALRYAATAIKRPASSITEEDAKKMYDQYALGV